MAQGSGSIQATMKAIKGKIDVKAAEQIEDKLKHVASYVVSVSPVDTGAYVESFSIGPANFGGGRSRKSEARSNGVKKGSGGANPESFRDTAREQLNSDIAGMDIPQMVESGNVKFTLRNRAPHAVDVENGESWTKDGYHVFAKTKRKFG